MNKTLIALVVMVLLLGGLSVYFYTHPKIIKQPIYLPSKVDSVTPKIDTIKIYLTKYKPYNTTKVKKESENFYKITPIIDSDTLLESLINISNK